MTSAPNRSLATRLTVAILATLVAMAAALALANPASADTASDEARLFQLTNESRVANGRAPLTYDPLASNVARAWAQDLARTASLRHNPNLVTQVDSQVSSAWSSLGENVGYAGSIDAVQVAYMNSAGHRSNILGNFNRVGVGSARSTDNRVWTTVVFLQGPALGAPAAPAAPAVPASTFVPFASASALVNQQYLDLLGRPADAAAQASWTSQLNSGQATPAAMVTSLLNSAEFGSMVEPVTRLYLAYFGRNPDVNGLTYWVGQLRAGAPLANVSNAFAGSSEFIQKYGSLDNLGFVNRVYANVLGRTADAGGSGYWVGQLANGAINRGGVMTGFSESGEYRNATNARVKVVSVYVGLLRRLPDTAGQTFWTGELNAGRSVTELISGLLASSEYKARRF